MGWTKRADALEVLKHHRAALRKKVDALNTKALRKPKGLDSEAARQEAWAVIFEFYRIEEALGYGRRDGGVPGVSLKTKREAPRIGPLVRALLRHEKKFTWEIKKAKRIKRAWRGR